MRWLGLFCGLILLGGCAAHPGDGSGRQVTAAPQYQEPLGASLAMVAPVVPVDEPVQLPREAREPSAFVGFDDISATYFYIRTDDRQMDGGINTLFRRAVQDRVGVSYR